jgi:Flp pilus assembly protein TadG
MRTMRRNHRPERGQALVEFALIAPIFFLLLFGIIQLGLLFGAQNGLVDAVRDSTRRAATYRVNDLSLTGNTLGAICQVVRTEIDSRLAKQIPGYRAANRTTTITYEWGLNNDNPQTYFLIAHVNVVYRHPLYVPLVNIVLDRFDGNSGDSQFTLEASEQMRIENPDLLNLGTDTSC